MKNLGYIFVPIANAIIELGKLITFGFLSYYFNNIWIMLFYVLISGGGMTLTSSEKNKEKENKKDE